MADGTMSVGAATVLLPLFIVFVAYAAIVTACHLQVHERGHKKI